MSTPIRCLHVLCTSRIVEQARRNSRVTSALFDPLFNSNPRRIMSQEPTRKKLKRGRPKKTASERRRHRVPVLFNDEELERFEKRRRGAGLPRATYLRRQALGERVPSEEGDEARRWFYGEARVLVAVKEALDRNGEEVLAERVEGLLLAISEVMREG